MIDSQRYQELERNYSITVRADGYLRQFETEDEEYGSILCEELEL